MTMRNAFEDIATDASARRIADNTQHPRALQYARDAQDRMRVTLGPSEANQTVSMFWGNSNAYPNWYSSGAPAAMDAREQQRELSMQTFQGQLQRWTFT